MRKLLILGGSDAGISAALRAKVIDPDAEVTMVVADRFPNFSICGLPFYISGEVQDWQTLAHRTIAEIEGKGIKLLLESHAEAIDPVRKSVRISGKGGSLLDLAYDSVLIATGGVSARPLISGIDLPGVFFLRWMEDGFAIHDYLSGGEIKAAAVIGGGYIGMEMADAFARRGIQTAVVEYAETVLTTLDADLGNLVRKELERNGVAVNTHTAVKEIVRSKGRLVVRSTEGQEVPADLVVVGTGSKPNANLARLAGVEIGGFGAIKVDRQMKTNLADVFAAGDCVETWHRVLEKYAYLPLGTTAHRQGSIAGANMAGGGVEFEGSLGTQVVKIFDLIAARTGLRDREASAAGYLPMTTQFEGWDHKAYYPGAYTMFIRITGDRGTGRLLGAQIVGHRLSEVSKRIDILAAMLYHRMKVAELEHVDLSYTPPLSSPWDPIQMAAQAWLQDRS
jgi:NADPH-dependent 2,4-dienoyl-CoA reductase/sulfur reductase-like enzyme